MSLLLKALKQAESANADKGSPGSGGPDLRIEGDLELEPAPPGTATVREWVEPPGLLFGSTAADAPPPPAQWRLPRLSLVPLTALIASVVALGYGIYLYLELQPPSSSAPASPPAPASVKAPPHATPAPSAPAQPLPAVPPAAEPVASPAPAPTPSRAAATATGEAPSPRGTSPDSVTEAPEPASLPPVTPRFRPDPQSGLVAQGYAAYARGALNEAARLYTQAVARGRTPDALLGLAAVAAAQGRDADAQRLYREVLDIDPRNATAQGALLDLLGNTDAAATESRLKALIEREPTAQLYQTLGNLYADQARWNDAQAAYFEAWRRAPESADYAYNLAVSLDQLGERAAALTYYQKALAGVGPHRFDRAAAQARIQQLQTPH